MVADRAKFASLRNSELPNYDLIVPALLSGGVEGLKESCKLTPGEFHSSRRRYKEQDS